MQKRSEHPRLKRWLVFSTLLHVAACVAYVALSLAKPDFIDDKKVISINIVQKGKTRDEKMLPRLVSEEPKSETPAVAKETPVPKETAPAPIKDKDLVKKESKEAKSVSKKTDAPRRNILDALQRRLKTFEKEGNDNGAAYGNSLTGDLADAYEARVLAMLYESFLIPSLISKSEARSLMVRVKIQIGSNGEPSHVGVISPSHNSDFDNAVVSNARAIASFGPPPLPLRKKLLRDGLEIEMCPYKCPKKD